MDAIQAITGVGPVVRSVQSGFPSSIIVVRAIAWAALRILFDLVVRIHRHVLGPCSKM